MGCLPTVRGIARSTLVVYDVVIPISGITLKVQRPATSTFAPTPVPVRPQRPKHRFMAFPRIVLAGGER